MEFVDRKKELLRLRRSLESDKKRFIVIYGRRRVGKSALVKRVLTDRDVYFEADLDEPAIQMSQLAGTIRMTYPEFADATYQSWEAIFLHFNAICDDNATLCLDEFPYLVKKNPALPSILQRLLDSGVFRFNLIVCGSTIRMMKKIIMDAADPLYGRADEKISLRPIPLPYWKEAFRLDAVAAFEEFTVWGGVPRYWVLREDYDSLWDAVEGLILDEHGLLADEPNALFLDETSDISIYSSIMTAVGGGHTRFSAIADRIGRKTTEISVPIKNLQEMSYVEKEVPFGENEDKTRKTLYWISDPFMAFYYRFVAANKSYLALGRYERIKERIQREFNTQVGSVWERSCAQAVSFRNLFGTDWGVASRWWGSVPVRNEGGKAIGGQEIELDVVAASEDGRSVLIGECKWNAPDFADRLLRTLKAKVAAIPQFSRYEVEYVLFLRERPIDAGALDDLGVHVLYPEDVISLL